MVRTGRFDHDGVAYSFGIAATPTRGRPDPDPLRAIGGANPSC
jgi:hypothetical protein